MNKEKVSPHKPFTSNFCSFFSFVHQNDFVLDDAIESVSFKPTKDDLETDDSGPPVFETSYDGSDVTHDSFESVSSIQSSDKTKVCKQN